MFSVLYTHQKAKKAKTWQDGILRVKGNKAKLCDEESKLLDSFFIQNDQVSAGEELESDRYLITIEERLDSSADHSQGCNSQRVEQREVSNTPRIYQPNKRKRQCFQPPKINQTTPALSRHLGPECKKPRTETVLQQNTNLYNAESRVSSKNDFFNMYSACFNNLEVEGDSRHHGNKQVIPNYNSSSVLQRSKFQNLCVTPQRHDQVVPLNVTGPSKGGVLKENKALTNSVPSKSTIPLQNGSPNNRSFSEGKRNSAQILALFSAFKNTPQLQLLTDAESKYTDQARIELIGKSPSRFEGNLNNSSSPKDAVRLDVETKGFSGTAYQPQINATYNVSLEQDLMSSEDLGNSFNFPPDSFAACSSEEKAEVTSAVGQTSPTGDVAFVAKLPDDYTQDWESQCETQLSDVCSHDSESVSPLMKHLTSSVQDRNKSDSEANANSKEKRGWLFDFSSNNSQLPKHIDIQSSSSPTAHHPSSVRCTSTDSCLIQKYPQGSSYASEKTIGEADFIPASPLTEQNLLSFRQEASTRFAGTSTKDVSLRDYEKMPQTLSRTENISTEVNGFSSHPGSAFAYTALESGERSDKSLRDKRFGNLEPWNASLGLKDLEDTDDGLSPEFYPPDSGKVTRWRVAPIVSTKVIPTDSRTVKAGEGHSWKGSVVSDTVKRDSHSVPMVTVQRQELYTPSTCPQGDQRIPSSDLTTWVDSILSTDVCEDSPHFMSGLERGFATSESLAMSSTKGFIKSSQFADQNRPGISDFVQRVPQLSKRRAPILTAPREDHGIQQTAPENTPAHKITSAGMSPTKHYFEFSNVLTAFHAESKSLCDGTELAVKENKENSAPVGSCRRVGLRRVGFGKSRELLKNQQEFCQTREEIHGKQDGYRPPTVPSYMAGTLSGNRSMAGQLYFPTAEECDSGVIPTRKITVPVTFEDVIQYKQVFKAALREHLNIVLFELARSYHSALQKVDVSGFDTNQQGNHQTSDGPSCHHGRARLRAVKKDGPNKGRLFYTCSATGQSQCKFFKWADEYEANKTGSKEVGQKSSSKLTVSSPDSLMSFLKSHNVAFYCECRLIRKHTDSGGKFGAAKTKKWGRKRNSDLENKKKGLNLELPRKEHSSTYSKDDIWIISKKLSFEQESTFIASSAYYGPSSGGELEITPISGYSPSNWTSGEVVHALMACNAGTELTCISNIEEHVKLQNMPVLSYILQREQTVELNVRTTSRTSSFVPPMLTTCSNQLDLPSQVTESLAEEMIARFDLNKDQATALLSCARMFNSSVDVTSPSPPVCLIHGVFGAGKSFLLAVAVLYLVELFKVSDSLNNHSTTQSQLKILVSSTTNVAVDRILLGLLELGFDEFVRVGSIRKIAKPVLPYSVHSTGSDSQELKELQALLKTELTPSERTYVRKSIERHKLGENKKKLSQVRVVGVTCAACVFPCLDKLKLQILLLDECSQMTEPASLLPMARFECQKLVLVGDPKQLSPTIQGSEPEHEAGLEQTLFDRLMKMGYEPTLLRTQYRCHPAISAISNRLFYDNKLLDGVSAEDRSPIVNLVPTLCFYNVAKGREKCGNDGSYYNEEEAKFVAFLIKSLLESGVQPSQIGVITLYKSQLRTIASQLTASGTTSHAEIKAIQISTVDAFQGGEKDVIILSCVRTDHIGFIDCDKRSNVALTRAKRHLLIVGSLKMLSCNAVWGKVIQHCRNLPNGLCNSDEFMKKFQEKESNALDEDLEDSKGHADQLSNIGRQNAVKVTSDSSSLSQPFSACGGALRKGLETETRPCEENTSSVDIIDTKGGEDEDSDFDLPTFDLISSLGI